MVDILCHVVVCDFLVAVLKMMDGRACIYDKDTTWLDSCCEISHRIVLSVAQAANERVSISWK